MAPFIAIDIIFISANVLKIADGGYVPMLVALGIMFCMRTWVTGARILSDKIGRTEPLHASQRHQNGLSGPVHFCADIKRRVDGRRLRSAGDVRSMTRPA
jgi:hypothetical protein